MDMVTSRNILACVHLKRMVEEDAWYVGINRLRNVASVMCGFVARATRLFKIVTGDFMSLQTFNLTDNLDSIRKRLCERMFLYVSQLSKNVF